jgi:hypothetical protein
MDKLPQFLDWHAKALETRLQKQDLINREIAWSRAIANGGKSWLAELSAKENLKGAQLVANEGMDGKINFLIGKR